MDNGMKPEYIRQTINLATPILRNVLVSRPDIVFIACEVPEIANPNYDYNFTTVAETNNEETIIEWIETVLKEQGITGEALLSYDDYDGELLILYYRPFARVFIQGYEWVRYIWNMGQTLYFRSGNNDPFWVLIISRGNHFSPFHIKAERYTIRGLKSELRESPE